LNVSFPGIKYLISEGIRLKFKSDIIFLDFVAVVNIVLPWIEIPQVESDIDFEVVNSYTTDLSGIYNIITVDDKSTWVNDFNQSLTRKGEEDKKNIQLLKASFC
jgi:hypothetical protein